MTPLEVIGLMALGFCAGYCGTSWYGALQERKQASRQEETK
jgi:hypothetical protein